MSSHDTRPRPPYGKARRRIVEVVTSLALGAGGAVAGDAYVWGDDLDDDCVVEIDDQDRDNQDDDNQRQVPDSDDEDD